MSHTHLNYLKRCQILALLKAGFNQSQIAKEIGVHRGSATIIDVMKYLCYFVSL